MSAVKTEGHSHFCEPRRTSATMVLQTQDNFQARKVLLEKMPDIGPKVYRMDPLQATHT